MFEKSYLVKYAKQLFFFQQNNAESLSESHTKKTISLLIALRQKYPCCKSEKYRSELFQRVEGRICIIVQGILILKNTQNISQENTLLDDCPRQMPTSKGIYSPTLVEYSCTNTVRLLPSHLQILLGLAVPFDLLQSMLGWSFVYQF